MFTQQKKFIIIEAIAFCFGPISSTLNFTKQLKKKLHNSYDIIFIGNGTSYQLAQKSQLFNNLIECDTRSNDDLNKNLSILKKAELIITNTNAFFAEFASKKDIPTVYIDTLYWMWDELTNDFSKVKKYYIEDFHCINYEIDRFQVALPNPKIVAPLIEMPKSKNSEIDPNLLLVNFGGIDSDFTKPPKLYLNLIKWLMQNSSLKNKQIVIAGGGKTIDNLKRSIDFEIKNIEINCFSQSEYISLLSKSKKVISSPGVHSFYEIFFNNKDVFFLLPQNYSQYLQMKYITKNFHSVKGCHTLNIDKTFFIPENLPEVEGIKILENINEKIITSDKYLNHFFSILDRFLDFNIKSTIWDKPFPYKKSGAEEIVEDLLNSNILKEVEYV